MNVPGRAPVAGRADGISAVTITEAPLVLDELVEIAAGRPVELGPGAQARIRASRAVVDQALASGAPVYGLTTGVGHLKDERVPDDELRGLQRMLVITHAGGIGPPLRTELVRAALAVRLNGIARGGSGASPAVAEVLVAMLNAGVHPIVAETGSVGAGDLAQMASMALVAIGLGRAELAGEVVDGAEAMRRAGIEPLVLQPKDGLAFISANGFSIGQAALVAVRAGRLAEAADLAAALSLEATAGNPSIALPVVGQAKPFDGQIEAARNLRALLDGSGLFASGATRSIQDPLSLRVVPQVHGALRECLGFARRAVDIELNGRSDNPLVSIEDEALIHNGNFHPAVLAIAFDALRVAVAHVGQLSERRMSHLWTAFFGNLAAPGAPGLGDASAEAFGMSLRYPAAAVLSELKQLAAPATLDTAPLDMDVEDHATGAPLSVRKAETSLQLLQDLLAIELLLARDVLVTMPTPPTLGNGATAALHALEEAIASSAGRSPAEIHHAVRTRLLTGQAT